MSRPRRCAGFTLLELMVALAIMGLSLGLLYRTGGGALRDAGAAGHLQGAILVAESLAELHDSVPAGGWNEAGRSAAYAWQIASGPYEDGAPDDGRVALQEVRIAVRWEEGGRSRSFAHTTLLPVHRAAPGAAR